jgi:hypothetical protein
MTEGHFAVNAFPLDHWIDDHWPDWGAVVGATGRVCITFSSLAPSMTFTKIAPSITLSSIKPSITFTGEGCST